MTDLAIAIVQEMGLSKEQGDGIRLAGMIHERMDGSGYPQGVDTCQRLFKEPFLFTF